MYPSSHQNPVQPYRQFLRITLESALPVTLTASCFLINYSLHGMSGKMLSVLWEMSLGKVYISSLLGVFNSKVSLRQGEKGMSSNVMLASLVSFEVLISVNHSDTSMISARRGISTSKAR
jgi:hypothetical protein